MSELSELLGKDIKKLSAKQKVNAEAPAYEDVGLEQDFADLVEEREQVRTVAKELDGEMDRLNLEIAKSLVKKGTLSAKVLGGVVRITYKGRSHIDKMKLVELKVPIAVIEKATTATQSPSLSFYPNKRNGNNGNGEEEENV